MGAFQRQIGDMVELTPEGEKEIHKYKNNYADATKPLSSKERNWSAWDMGNLWIGMIVSIAVYQVASGLIVSGMSWAQALLTIVLGHTLVMILQLFLDISVQSMDLVIRCSVNGVWIKRNCSPVNCPWSTWVFLVRCSGMDWRSGT